MSVFKKRGDVTFLTFKLCKKFIKHAQVFEFGIIAFLQIYMMKEVDVKMLLKKYRLVSASCL